MKRFSQILSLVLVFSMVLVLPAMAATGTTRASDYFGSHSVYMNKVSSTKIEACFTVTAVGTMDKLGANYITIQRSADGSNWENVATYTKEAYPSLVRSNAGIHTGSVSCTYNSNYRYRAYIQFYAKKGTGTGYVSDYSSSI